MSYYDVDIGKLISGRRALEGIGKYWLCSPQRSIEEISSFSPNEGIFVSRQDVENELYDFCKAALASYVEEGKNKEVYTFSIYTDTYSSSYVVYINNRASLNETVDEYFAKYKEEYTRTGNEIYGQSREQLYRSLQFGEGDYPFMFEEMPDRLESYLNIISCISEEDPRNLRIEQNYIFDKTIADSELFLIAIDVIHRLQDDFQMLDRTEDFIAYVSAADGVGGDYLTLSQLIRKSVPEDRLHQAMPELKEKDLEFRSAVETVQQLPFDQQVKHWVTVIDGGEFGEGSMRSFWRTDYDAYEQLVELGSQAIPYIQELLNTNINEETKDILKVVLEDLGCET